MTEPDRADRRHHEAWNSVVRAVRAKADQLGVEHPAGWLQPNVAQIQEWADSGKLHPTWAVQARHLFNANVAANRAGNTLQPVTGEAEYERTCKQLVEAIAAIRA